jgi:hypothetical protein
MMADDHFISDTVTEVAWWGVIDQVAAGRVRLGIKV